MKNDFGVESKSYRLFSILTNVGYVTFGIAVCLALVVASLLTIGVLSIVPGIVLLLLIFVGFPLAVFDGCKNPRRFLCPPSLRQWMLPGIFGFLGFCFIGYVFFGILWFANRSVNSGHFHGEWSTYECFCADRHVKELQLKKLLPSQSKDIYCHGVTDTFFPSAFLVFRCKVSEGDFRDFAEENGYELTVDVLRNANTEIVDGDFHPAEITIEQVRVRLKLKGDDLPRRYLGYWYGYSNLGGLILVYDLDAGILYGSYSTN